MAFGHRAYLDGAAVWRCWKMHPTWVPGVYGRFAPRKAWVRRLDKFLGVFHFLWSMRVRQHQAERAGLEARWSSGESRALVPVSAGVRDDRLVQVLPAHARMIPESRYYRVYYCGALRACGNDLECDACRYVTKMAEQEDDACSREKFCRIVEHRWVELD